MADTFTTLLKLIKSEIGGDNNTWGDNLNTMIDALDAIYRDEGGDLVTGGAANAYTITPAWGDPTGLADGLHVRVRIHAANTTASTVVYDGFGPTDIKKMVQGVPTALVADDLATNHYASLIYSETEAAWIIENPVVIDTLRFHDWVDVASSGTTTIDLVKSMFVNITGTTTITSLGAGRSGDWRIVKFASALTLTHNAVTLILPGAVNITTVAGDVAMFKAEGGSNWRCLFGFGIGGSGSMATAAEIWVGTTTKSIGVDQMMAALAEVALTDGATVTVNFSLGINFKLVTIGGNRTLAMTVAAGQVGRSGYIRVKQDGTGSRTLAMTASPMVNINGQNLVLSTSADAEDVIFYTIISTTKVLLSMARDIS